MNQMKLIKKQAVIERVGAECKAEHVPFLLEILTYDDQIGDEKVTLSR